MLAFCKMDAIFSRVHRITFARLALHLLSIIISFVLLSVPRLNAQPPDTLWTRTFDFSNEYEWPSAATATSDGGWILTGSWGSFAMLIRLDGTGNVLWTRLGCDGSDILRTGDGGYLIAGRYYFGPQDYATLVRTNSFGDTLWSRRLGADWGIDVDTSANAIFELCGSPYWGEIFTIAKADGNGDSLWTRTINVLCSEDAIGGVAATSDGGCGVLVQAENLHFAYYGYPKLYRFDSNGELMWTYAHADSNFGSLTNLVALPDG